MNYIDIKRTLANALTASGYRVSYAHVVSVRTYDDTEDVIGKVVTVLQKLGVGAGTTSMIMEIMQNHAVEAFSDGKRYIDFRVIDWWKLILASAATGDAAAREQE